MKKQQTEIDRALLSSVLGSSGSDAPQRPIIAPIQAPMASRREKPGRPPAFPSGVDVVRLTVTVEKSTWKALRAYLTENETTQNETVNAALRRLLGME